MSGINKKPPKQYKKILKKYRINASESLKAPETVLEILNNDKTIPLLTKGNFSLITGKAKSRKSFLVGLFISFSLSNNKNLLRQFYSRLASGTDKILYFDTEQGKYHGQLALKRICKLINIQNPKKLKMFCLRSLSPIERLEAIEYAIYKYKDVYLVVIDGIKDLITSINSEEEATYIASKLLKWTEERNIHIICVLHQNKGDNNARGHLGSELVHKSETVLSVTKDSENKGISIVEPVMCRNEEPNSFAFEIVEGLPLIIDDYEISPKRQKRNSFLTIPDYEKFQLLSEVFSKKDEYLLTELTNALQKVIKERKPNLPSGANNMRKILEYMKNKKWLLQDAPRRPYTQGIYENLE